MAESQGDFFRRLRTERGLSVQEVALQSGVAPRSIARLEANESEPFPSSVKRLIIGIDLLVALTDEEIAEAAQITQLSEHAIRAAINRPKGLDRAGRIPRIAEPDGAGDDSSTEVDVRALADPQRRAVHSKVAEMLDAGVSPVELLGLLEHISALRDGGNPGGVMYREEHPPRQSPGEDLPRKATVLKRYTPPESTPGESRTGRRKSS